MLKKLKLGSSLAALFLFALPWIEIQCSERNMVTQSGLQVIYGGGSPSEEMEALGDDTKASQAADSEESMGFAPLVALALIAVIGAVGFSVVALFRGGERAEFLSSVLPAAALILLLIQLMIGFPAKKQFIEAMSEGVSETQAVDDEFVAAMGESMAAAMMMNIRVKTTPAFYFELLALVIPTLLLLNSLIDKYRKSEQGVAPNA